MGLVSDALNTVVKATSKACKRAFHAYLERLRYRSSTPDERAARRAHQRHMWALQSHHEQAKSAWANGGPYYRSITLRAVNVPKEDIPALRALAWHALDPGLRDAIARLEPTPKGTP